MSQPATPARGSRGHAEEGVDHGAVLTVRAIDAPPDAAEPDSLKEPGSAASRLRSTTGRSGRMPGLDGLRGVAVAAVVLFHLDVDRLPGGFLGVDVFFVISGFLITQLLLAEIVATGRLDFARFYWRRARRLLPAVLALIAVVVLASVLVWRDQLSSLVGSATSSLFYVGNWWLIGAHQSYFASTGRPPMLQHLWSLGVEEQYYLVWPILVVTAVGVTSAVLRRASLANPARTLRRVVLLALLLSAASTLTMAVLAIRGNVPYETSSSRVYFGADTHSMGLFLGSAAGAWRVLRRLQPLRPTRAARAARAARLRAGLSAAAAARLRGWLLDLVGLAALALVVRTFFAVNEFSQPLYRGGFLLFDAVVLVVILAATRAGSRLGQALDCRPLRWVGLRSYSIYLWHWPVFVVTRPGLDLHGASWLIDAARLGLATTLGALSYRLVELRFRAIRAGAPARPAQMAQQPRVGPSPRVVLGAVGILACVAVLATGAAAPLPTAGPRPAALVHSAAPTPGRRPGSSPSRGQVSGLPGPGRSSRPIVRPAPGGHSVAGRAPLPRLSVFGDSVVLGAVRALKQEFPQVSADAVEGRQAFDVLTDVQAQNKAGRLDPVVLIHVGDNGIVSPQQLRDTLQDLASRQLVLLMTVRVYRDWQSPNNQIIKHAAHGLANVDVIDWYTLSANHPSWFYQDGLHLDPAGASAYARIVVAAVRHS